MHQLQAIRAVVNRLTVTDSDSGKMKSILDRLEKEASGLVELMTHPDPMKSSVANDLVVNAEKSRLRALAGESREKLSRIVSGRRAASDAARLAKARLMPDDHAAEIRGVFRSLDPAAKHSFMAEAIKTGDASTIAAIVTARPLLSGLSAEESAHYREAFLESVAPHNDHIAEEMQAICDTAIRTVESLATPAAGQSSVSGASK
jgi:hypothetical protein